MGVKFNMPGWWELDLGIEGPKGADDVTFNLVLFFVVTTSFVRAEETPGIQVDLPRSSAQAIVNEGLRNVAAGANPMLLKRGILAAADEIARNIASQATPISTKAEIASVASVSRKPAARSFT